jgi:hypothetical protein
MSPSGGVVLDSVLPSPEINILKAEDTRFIFIKTNSLPFIQTSQQEQSLLSKGVNLGRAIAQAVSHWLPTAAARAQTRV